MSNFKDNSGLEEDKPKASQAERDELMKKFLAKGGKVQKLKPTLPIYTKHSAFTREEIANGVSGKAPRPNYNTYKPGSYHDFDVGGDNPPEYIKPMKNEPPIK